MIKASFLSTSKQKTYCVLRNAKIEVFAQPLQDRATAVIVAHNHPSGNLDPSKEDMSVTRRLIEAGSILGIDLLDHIIFSEDGYFSFLEQGMMHS